MRSATNIFTRLLDGLGGRRVTLPATDAGPAATPAPMGGGDVSFQPGAVGEDVSFREVDAHDGRTVRMSRGSRQLILIMADGSPSMGGMLAGVSRGVSSLVSCLAPVADRVMVGGVVWSDSPRLVAPIAQVDRFSMPSLSVQGSYTMVVPAARWAIAQAKVEYDRCVRNGDRYAPTLVVWFSDMRFSDNVAEVAAELHQAETSGLISSYAVKYGTEDSAEKARKHEGWMATLAPNATQRFVTGESTDFREILRGVGNRSFSDVGGGRGGGRGVDI